MGIDDLVNIGEVPEDKWRVRYHYSRQYSISKVTGKKDQGAGAPEVHMQNKCGKGTQYEDRLALLGRGRPKALSQG